MPYINFGSYEERILYYKLKKLNVPIYAQYKDGYKTVDIAIPSRKIYIEIDGKQHSNHKQALADLRREYYSYKHGWYTLHIPNELVKNHLEEIARIIRAFCFEKDKKHT